MAGAGVEGLLFPPAAKRAAVAMAPSPRLLLPTETSRPIRDRSKYETLKEAMHIFCALAFPKVVGEDNKHKGNSIFGVG